MTNLGVWAVSDKTPTRLTKSNVRLEKHLEDWIEQDPALVQSGLTIVGRQVRLSSGIADLLAIDAQGRWVVIEVKREAIYRETVAQALDYAAALADMGREDLETRITAYV